MKNFVIILILIGVIVFVINTPDSYGLIMDHPMEFGDSADVILDGTVILTKNIDSESLVQHDIRVEQFFKNKKSQNMITVYDATIENQEWFYSKFFETNDGALFYLKKSMQVFLLEHSYKATEQSTSRDMIGLSIFPEEGLIRGGHILFFNPYQTCNDYVIPAGFVRYFLPPLKQIEAGITSSDIGCRNDNQLMFRENGSNVLPKKQGKLLLFGQKLNVY